MAWNNFTSLKEDVEKIDFEMKDPVYDESGLKLIEDTDQMNVFTGQLSHLNGHFDGTNWDGQRVLDLHVPS